MPRKDVIEANLQLTPVECEIATLKAVLDMVNDMVNYEMMDFSFSGPDSMVMFKTRTHMAFFSIILVDLLSEPRGFFTGEKNYIDRMRNICDNPLLGREGIEPLRKAVGDFSAWLSETVIIENRWFPSIDLLIDLRIQRQMFIRMCGNIAKHNFTQLTRQAEKLRALFEEVGQSIPLDRCIVALENFREQFYDDIFHYHSSTISEFLNDIRWGIYVYARSVRSACVEYHYESELRVNSYEYDLPKGVSTDLGKACFWNLMNDVRGEPYVQRYHVTKYLKMRY